MGLGKLIENWVESKSIRCKILPVKLFVKNTDIEYYTYFREDIRQYLGTTCIIKKTGGRGKIIGLLTDPVEDDDEDWKDICGVQFVVSQVNEKIRVFDFGDINLPSNVKKLSTYEENIKKNILNFCKDYCISSNKCNDNCPLKPYKNDKG